MTSINEKKNITGRYAILLDINNLYKDVSSEDNAMEMLNVVHKSWIARALEFWDNII